MLIKLKACLNGGVYILGQSEYETTRELWNQCYANYVHFISKYKYCYMLNQ